MACVNAAQVHITAYNTQWTYVKSFIYKSHSNTSHTFFQKYKLEVLILYL